MDYIVPRMKTGFTSRRRAAGKLIAATSFKDPKDIGGPMRRLLLVGLLVCLSLQVACTRGTESTEAAREQRTLTSSDLQKQVETKLNSNPQLRDANLSVSADADRNMVTLSGKVESESLRTGAIQMAKAVRPGLTVDDVAGTHDRVSTTYAGLAEDAREGDSLLVDDRQGGRGGAQG